jgi:hypothetical protein
MIAIINRDHELTDQQKKDGCYHRYEVKINHQSVTKFTIAGKNNTLSIVLRSASVYCDVPVINEITEDIFK